MTTQKLDPKLAEMFKNEMLKTGWQVTKQDAGQTHIVGWGYAIEWAKSSQIVSLQYQEIQGHAEAQLQISPDALTDINTMIDTLL